MGSSFISTGVWMAIQKFFGPFLDRVPNCVCRHTFLCAGKKDIDTSRLSDAGFSKKERPDDMTLQQQQVQPLCHWCHAAELNGQR
jgi:hypothetical protein